MGADCDGVAENRLGSELQLYRDDGNSLVLSVRGRNYRYNRRPRIIITANVNINKYCETGR